MLHTAAGSALTARNKIISISAITGMPALQLQYVGDKAYGNYEVANTDDLVLFADDINGSTTKVLTIETDETDWNSFGEIVDAINATGVFRAFLIGARRDDLSTTMLDAVSNETCKLKHGVTLFFEQVTTAQVYGIGITNQKFIYRPTDGWATFNKGWTKDINAINSLKNISIHLEESGTPAHGIWYIYANDDENKQNGVLLHSEVWEDDTPETHGMTVPDKVHWACPRGHRMSVQFLATNTSTNDFTGCVIKATGHTKDVAGGQVPDKNYTGCV